MSTSTAFDRAGSLTAPGPVAVPGSDVAAAVRDAADEPEAAQSWLARLTACGPAEFASTYWGRQPLLSRARDLPVGAADVLTLADVDALLAERGLRTPFIRLTKDGTVVNPSRYTSGGGAGATINDQVNDTLLTELLLDGTTVVLQGLSRTWRPVTDLVSRLSAELAVPVQANAYITPADSRGFDNHYDVHDVFVLQLSGRKHWQVHAPVHLHPLADQPWTDHRAAVEARSAERPLLDVVLEPGDVLYLPRGTVHGALTRDSLSSHLTLGLHPVTGHAAAVAALNLLKVDEVLRSSLPAGVALDTAAGEAAVASALTALRHALDELTPASVAQALAGAVLPQTRPVPLAPLAQAATASALTASTRLRLRTGLQTYLAVAGDGSALLRLPQRTQQVPAGELAAVRAVLAGESFAAGQLPELTPEDAVALSAVLLRRGVVVPA